jgi:hypothetical protein
MSLVPAQRDQVDLKRALASTHPIRGPELRALRELRRDYPNSP